jgi:hypothetical protein
MFTGKISRAFLFGVSPLGDGETFGGINKEER